MCFYKKLYLNKTNLYTNTTRAFVAHYRGHANKNIKLSYLNKYHRFIYTLFGMLKNIL